MQKNSHIKSKTIGLISIGGIALTSIALPVAAAVLVQNFTETSVVVEEPPIIKLQGADANYDGDNDDTTGYLKVDLGQTISNNDSLLGTPGSNDTLLSHEEIEFACFSGDRTYYTDVLRLQNTTASENWDVSLKIETDLAGNPAVDDTFADSNGDGGDADIWLITTAVDPTITPVTELPNPGNYGSLTQWLDGAGTNGAMQLEVIGSTLQTVAGSITTGPITFGAGETRQIGIVVDCGANMADEIAAGTTGIIRMTVEANPA